MCRIFGFSGDTRQAQTRAHDVIALLRHGGPDENGLTIHPDSLLGNCRLAIMDVENGSQPYRLGDKIEIVLNGEIYNHNELRRSLQAKGYTFNDHCDGSILPALYHEYGEDFISHLDGMFAVAVLDRRGPTKLLLAVDHLGIKPLYYTWDPAQKELSFASEIPALIRMSGVNPTMWLPGIDEYLTAKVVTDENTMYEGIKILKPQTMLTISPGQNPEIRKWSRKEEDYSNDRSLTETGSDLRALLKQEVSSLLRADVPVATINSGGLDSSFVSALASNNGCNPQAFHLAYAGQWPSDERKFAHQVADRLKIEQHDIILDPAEFPSLLPSVVRHLGQPFACPNNLSTYGLFRGVAKKGFKVVLSGDGADEMFGGYNRLQQLARDPQNSSAYLNSLGILNRAEREILYSKDYLAYLRQDGFAITRFTKKLQSMPGDTTLQKALEFERTVRLPSYHLHRVDHLSMAHSVEVRVPFCQRKILDFARRTSIDLMLDQEKRKKVLYEAATPHLPESVINRPKQPFTLPVGAIFRGSKELSSFARDVLSKDVVRSIGLFNPHAIDNLFEKERSCSNGKTAEAIWSLMMFHLWAKQPAHDPSFYPTRRVHSPKTRQKPELLVLGG